MTLNLHFFLRFWAQWGAERPWISSENCRLIFAYFAYFSWSTFSTLPAFIFIFIFLFYFFLFLFKKIEFWGITQNWVMTTGTKLYIHILQVCLRNNNKTCTSTNKIHHDLEYATTWFLAKVGSRVLGFLGTLLVWRPYCSTKHFQECN